MSHSDKIGILNAMDDPAHRELLEDMVGRMRAVTAPLLNAAMNGNYILDSRNAFG